LRSYFQAHGDKVTQPQAENQVAVFEILAIHQKIRAGIALLGSAGVILTILGPWKFTAD
jgi:hypothetical protein